MGLFFDGGFECCTARNFSIASLTKRCLYPLCIRCVVRALERVLKNSSFEQILLSESQGHAEGNRFLSVGWRWQDDFRRY